MCLFMTPADAAARIYVMLGQGGAATSLGMIGMAHQLAGIPGATVTIHHWEHYDAIAADIRRQPKGVPIILVGYSLGAGMTTYIASKVPSHRIALAVAYDPSVWAPPLPAGANIARLICFKNDNVWNIYGRAGIAGRQVETVHVNEGHMMVPFDSALHRITIAAVRLVIGGAP